MPLNVVMHAFACRFGHELGAQLRLKLHHARIVSFDMDYAILKLYFTLNDFILLSYYNFRMIMI